MVMIGSVPSRSHEPLQGARILVAGSTGFLGRHLLEALRGRGCTVVGVSRQGDRVGGRSTSDDVRHIAADLRDPESARRVIRQTQPTHVLHAAGVLPGPQVDWAMLHEGNVMTTLNVLEAIRAEGLDPWILLTSSSAVYGGGGGRSINEDSPFRPISLYGVAKATQELVGIQAQLNSGLRVILARIFNLVGPGQPASLVISDLARQVAYAEYGGESVIQVGNLESERDYVDVRDAAAAIALLAEGQVGSGPYNLASGTARSVLECLELLVELASKPLKIETVAFRQRKVDIRRQVGDSSKLRSAITWHPAIAFEDSLKDVLEHWRIRIREGRP